MYIGQLARQTGASAKAIRSYEALGLLAPVPRAGRYRHYTPEHLRQVRLIRQAMALGLRLAALRPHLAGKAGPDWRGIAALIEQRRAQLEAEQRRLRAQDAALAAVRDEILACLGGTPAPDCTDSA